MCVCMCTMYIVYKGGYRAKFGGRGQNFEDSWRGAWEGCVGLGKLKLDFFINFIIFPYLLVI